MPVPKKFEIIKNIRLATVIGVGTIGTLSTSFLVASGLRNAVASQVTLSDLTAILLGCTALGLLLTALFCLLVFHAFSFFESTTLGQAIRLNEAMRMLHAKTNQESLNALKYYGIPVFKAKAALGGGVEENVPCKLISTFLSPWFFHSDRIAAFGSDNHCCNFAQIQEIIEANKATWGEPVELSENVPAEVVALERRIADLLEKNKETARKFTAASAREGQLKKRFAEVEFHMNILVELANKVSNDVKPPRSITEKEIKAKYLAIGKIYGITVAPSTYVNIFREKMPTSIINWGGAPKKDFSKDET